MAGRLWIRRWQIEGLRREREPQYTVRLLYHFV